MLRSFAPSLSYQCQTSKVERYLFFFSDLIYEFRIHSWMDKNEPKGSSTINPLPTGTARPTDLRVPRIHRQTHLWTVLKAPGTSDMAVRSIRNAKCHTQKSWGSKFGQPQQQQLLNPNNDSPKGIFPGRQECSCSILQKVYWSFERVEALINHWRKTVPKNNKTYTSCHLRVVEDIILPIEIITMVVVVEEEEVEEAIRMLRFQRE